MFIRTNSLGVPNVHRRTRNMSLYFRLQMAAKASDGFIIRAVSNLIKLLKYSGTPLPGHAVTASHGTVYYERLMCFTLPVRGRTFLTFTVFVLVMTFGI